MIQMLPIAPNLRPVNNLIKQICKRTCLLLGSSAGGGRTLVALVGEDPSVVGSRKECRHLALGHILTGVFYDIILMESLFHLPVHLFVLPRLLILVGLARAWDSWYSSFRRQDTMNTYFFVIDQRKGRSILRV